MKERNYVNMQVNPCKMCMPMGASQAMKGIKKSMTIIHGSQGCSTYIRRHMAAHYNEPVDIASSSLSEEGTVYGGARNLKIGISNLVKMYQPEVVGVLTTCLAETIGDDIKGIVKEVRQEPGLEGVDIIPIPTPGYGASETEGYYKAVKAMIDYYSQQRQEEDLPVVKGNYVNVIVSQATCEDIREIKRLAQVCGVAAVIIPDISDVLDAPYKENFDKLHSEGTSREALKAVFGAKATIELGDLVADQYSTALYLEEHYGIKAYRCPLPIGLKNTDHLVEILSGLGRKDMPSSLKDERGRLLDGMIDSHKHSAMGKVAIYGEMDLVYGISGLMMENGVQVKTVMTGALSKKFKAAMSALSETYEQDTHIMQDSDFETLREVIRDKSVNLMIGNSNGKFIWEKDGVDLIRVGFPVHDHIGAQRKLRFGYKGSIRLLDQVVNTLLDQKHVDYKSRMYRAYYKGGKTEEAAVWEM